MSKSELPIINAIKDNIDSKTIKKAFSTLEKYEKDLVRVIEIAREMKMGVMKGSISKERQMEICDEIVKKVKA